LPHAEPGYGYPESGQEVVNVTNGKLIRLLVDDAPLDVRYGRLMAHERVLDLRAGTLTRDADWESPRGRRVRVRSTRLVSFTQRALAAIEYVVEPVDASVRLVVQSELVANEPIPPRSGDPRIAAVLENPLMALDQDLQDGGAVLVHGTRLSGLQMAAGGSSRRGARRGESGERGDGRLGADYVCVQPPAGAAAADCEVPRLRVVQP